MTAGVRVIRIEEYGLLIDIVLIFALREVSFCTTRKAPGIWGGYLNFENQKGATEEFLVP